MKKYDADANGSLMCMAALEAFSLSFSSKGVLGSCGFFASTGHSRYDFVWGTRLEASAQNERKWNTRLAVDERKKATIHKSDEIYFA